MRRRLESRGFSLDVSPPAINWLAEMGYDPAYGARPVRRAVRQHLLNPLALALIGGDDAAARRSVHVRLGADENGLEISVGATDEEVTGSV